MAASLRALLEGVVDYAGLFPPAGLPLDLALREYALYRDQAEAWMLGRFVVPAARLPELAAQGGLLGSGPPWPLAVLGRGGDTLAAFLAGLRADLDDVAAFQRRHGAHVRVEAFETRLPRDLARPPSAAEVAACVSAAAGVLGSRGGSEWAPYYEASLGPAWRQTGAVVAGLARARADAARRRSRPAGFKLRCGGSVPSAFPSPEQAALTLAACRDAGVGLKFTAGLHQPVRHPAPGGGTTAHGFLNVFVAGVLAQVRRADEGRLRQLLEDEDAGHFAFDDAGLRWQDLHATTAEVRAARQGVVSFGSCSFDEPRAGLRALGLL